uniref:hypothetical protein n=1 Tax=Salmonella sp. TaxID=599 RepID=UPI001CDA1DBF|nr:hypothetical protein [Salmonella sp.]
MWAKQKRQRRAKNFPLNLLKPVNRKDIKRWCCFNCNDSISVLHTKETPQIKGEEKALFFIKDGDASQKSHALSLTRDDEESELYAGTLKENKPMGPLRCWKATASFNPEGTQRHGPNPAWIPTLLESQSTRIGAVLADNAEASAAQLIFEDVALKVVIDGDLSEIDTEDYLKH